jgi:drug/metabolite transporter (DMT)-like permease
LVAFAANSVLCRLALGARTIDPYAFTGIRIVSGALVLAVWSRRRARLGRRSGGHGSWRGALALSLYALPFSLAYVRLSTGVGALLLFGAVQLTMMGVGIRRGERPSRLEWCALLGAFGGLVYLVLPGLSAPDPWAAAFMVFAGIGWGLYSLFGKGATDPTATTAHNFLRAGVVIVPVALLAWPALSVSLHGVVLACASGALASGLGYAVWYAVLPRLSTTRAALVQLAVPVLAATGGVVVMDEQVTPRLVIAAIVVLGSIALGILGRKNVAARAA